MAVDRVAHRTPMNATGRAIAQKAVSLSAAPAAETHFFINPYHPKGSQWRH